MAFVERLIDVTFTLGGGGSFGAQGNTLKLSGLRVSCDIVKLGSYSNSDSHVTVWGMTRAQMNQLSTLGQKFFVSPNDTVAIGMAQNRITVEAGDAESGMSQVFTGVIREAWADFAASPNVGFHVLAFPVVIATINLSYSGPVLASTVLKAVAAAMNMPLLNFLSNDPVLSDSHFLGTTAEIIRAVSDHTHINVFVDDGALVALNQGQARPDEQPVEISPSTGLVRYPSYVQAGVRLRALFNPAFRFLGLIRITGSIAESANGVWRINSLIHNLDSKVPSGRWFSNIEALGSFRPPA